MQLFYWITRLMEHRRWLMKSTNRRQFEAQEQTLGVCDKRSDVFRDNPVADEMLAQLRASTGSVKAADAEHRAGIAAVRIATLERGRVRITMRRCGQAVAAPGAGRGIYMNALGHDDQAVRDWKEARRIGPARAKQASAPTPEPSPVKVA